MKFIFALLNAEKPRISRCEKCVREVPRVEVMPRFEFCLGARDLAVPIWPVVWFWAVGVNTRGEIFPKINSYILKEFLGPV